MLNAKLHISIYVDWKVSYLFYHLVNVSTTATCQQSNVNKLRNQIQQSASLRACLPARQGSMTKQSLIKIKRSVFQLIIIW
jgi:hypothetical protein